jgi:hypothetical protein
VKILEVDTYAIRILAGENEYWIGKAFLVSASILETV